MKRKTTIEFIKEAKKIHGEKYSYEKSFYVTNKTNLTIICPIHGEFDQTPSGHIIKKSGCQKCGIQHYIPNSFSSDQSYLTKIKTLYYNLKLDRIKEKWCEKNKIPLLIIPFWELKRIDEILSSWLSGETPCFVISPLNSVTEFNGLRKRMIERIDLKLDLDPF